MSKRVRRAGRTKSGPVDSLVALGRAFRGIDATAGDTNVWASLALTTAQLKAVMSLVESGGLATCELARRLNMAQSGVTPLVDKLVTLKLVRRVRVNRTGNVGDRIR